MIDYYQVISYPMPIPNSDMSSQLINYPLTFGIDTEKQFYITSNELLIWHSHFHAHADNHLIPISHESCILGIFMNDAQMVSKLCDFRVFQLPFSQKIFPHNSQNLLAFNMTNISFYCPFKNITAQSCSFCLIDIPCACSILTPDFYLPPKLQNCQTKTNYPKVLQFVNLPLIQQFFDLNTTNYFKNHPD